MSTPTAHSHRPPAWRAALAWGLLGAFHGSMLFLVLGLLSSAWDHGISLASLCDLLLIPVVLASGPFYFWVYFAHAIRSGSPPFRFRLVSQDRQPEYRMLVDGAAAELGMKSPAGIGVHHGANGYAIFSQLLGYDLGERQIAIGVPLFMGSPRTTAISRSLSGASPS